MHQATLDLQKAMQKMKKSYREYYILKMYTLLIVL